MLKPMRIEDIGFGRVERPLNILGERRLRGDKLTLEELRTMPTANRNALIENRMISVFPRDVGVRSKDVPVPTAGPGELMVYTVGFGQYDVVQGTVVRAGVTKDEADAFLASEARIAAETPPVAPVAPGSGPVMAPPAGKPERPTLRTRGKKGKRRARGAKATPPPPPSAPDEPQQNGPL